MGKLSQILQSWLPATRTYFQDNNLSKPQLIFTNLDMLDDNKEIWFGIAN